MSEEQRFQKLEEHHNRLKVEMEALRLEIAEYRKSVMSELMTREEMAQEVKRMGRESIENVPVEQYVRALRTAIHWMDREDALSRELRKHLPNKHNDGRGRGYEPSPSSHQ